MKPNGLGQLPNPGTSLDVTHLNIVRLETDYLPYPDVNFAKPPEIEQDPETSPKGFGEVNHRTEGKEFYGPAATLAFLLELRRCARAYQQQTRSDSGNIMLSTNDDTAADPAASIVNFLHGDDEMLSGRIL